VAGVTATAWRRGTDRVRLPRDRRTGVAPAFATACVSGAAVYVSGRGVARVPDATTDTTVAS
jgi:hypothetical protein